MAEPTTSVSLFEINELESFRDNAYLIAAEANVSDTWVQLKSILRRKFPEKLQTLLNRCPGAKFAYSSCNQQLAVLLNGQLEIRGSVAVSFKMLPDERASWRKLAWSATGSLLICARSVAILDVFDVRNYCFTVRTETASECFDPLKAVAAISSKPATDNNAWSDQVFVLQYDGSLHIYFMGRIAGYHPLAVVRLRKLLSTKSLVATCMAILADEGTLLIGSEYELSVEKSRSGLAVFALNDRDPFVTLQHAPSLENDTSLYKIRNGIVDRLVSFGTPLKPFAQQIVTNFDRSRAACLISCVEICIFDTCDMKRTFYYSCNSLLENDESVVGIAWWSTEVLLLAFSTGVLSFLNLRSKRTEVLNRFSPRFSLEPVSDGHLFVLEQTDFDSTAAVISDRKSGVYQLLALALIKMPYELIRRSALLFVGAPVANEERSKVNALNESDNSGAVSSVSLSLHEIKAKTPEELFEAKLSREDFAEALLIAEKYNLDRDKVYQTGWLKNSHAISSNQPIDDYLAKIKNTKWVVDECVKKIPTSADVCRYLLKFGLQTTRFVTQLNENELTNDQLYFVHQRLKILKYLDRLEDYDESRTFENFSSATDSNLFDATFFTKIRNFDVLQMAVYFARNNHFSSLRAMFSRYKSELYSYWLFLLNNICEIVDVRKYEYLLPKLSDLMCLWEDRRRRNADSLENSKIHSSSRKRATSMAPENLLLVSEPPSVDRLVEWFQTRSIDIEQFTGLPDLAERFLGAAISLGFQDLTPFRDDMVTLRRLNYDCCPENPIDYRHFVRLTPADVANELLKGKSGEKFASELFRSVVPYFQHCQSKRSEGANRLVYDYLLQLSKVSLKPLLSVLQSLHAPESIGEDSLLLLTGEDLIDLSIDSINACDEPSADQLERAFKILASLPHALSVDSARKSGLDFLENRLKAMEILANHELSFSFDSFRRTAANADDSALLLRRLIRRAVENDADDARDKLAARKSNSHWRGLLKDMFAVCRLALAGVTERECLRIFVEGLLLSKRKRLIRMASDFFHTDDEHSADDKLSAEEAKRLVLSSGVSYINEAVSAVDDSLVYANLCFSSIAPPSEEIRREMDFVSSLPILAAYGVKDLPTRLRLYDDKSRLVDEIMSKNRHAYKDLQKLTTLCRYLRIPSSTGDAAAYATTVCARRALEAEDWSACAAYCKELVSAPSSGDNDAVWRICRALATDERFDDKSVKRDLLQFCLSRCRDDQLSATLADYVRLKNELSLQRFLTNDVASAIGEETEKYFGKGDDDFAEEELVLDAFCSDAVYVPRHCYRVDDERKDDGNVANLFDFAHVLSSSGVDSREKVDTLTKFYYAIARRSLPSNPMVCWSILLNMADEDVVHNCLSTFHATRSVVELAVYSLSLTFCRRNVNNASSTLLSLPRRHVVALTPLVCRRNSADADRYMQILTYWQRRLDSIKQRNLLNRIPSGIMDRKRFEEDLGYRRDTVLGFALCGEETSYATAVRLAEQFDIDEFDVHWTHLTYLFTDSGSEASVLQDCIKKRRLLDKLLRCARPPDRVAERFARDIYALLKGSGHQILVLYYMAVEKLCADSAEIVAESQTHRTLLRHVAKFAPGIDYKKLVSTDSGSLDVVMPFLNADNFATFAKVLTKIPTKLVTLEDVLGVWARKVFVDVLPKVGVEEAFRKCRPVLLKLNPATVVTFARTLLISDAWMRTFCNNDTDRLRALNLLVEFTKSEEKFAAASVELESWRETVSPSNKPTPEVVPSASSSADAASADSEYEPSDLEKSLKSAKSLLAVGKIREAGCRLLKAYDVPKALATHNTALSLALRSKDDVAGKD